MQQPTQAAADRGMACIPLLLSARRESTHWAVEDVACLQRSCIVLFACKCMESPLLALLVLVADKRHSWFAVPHHAASMPDFLWFFASP